MASCEMWNIYFDGETLKMVEENARNPLQR